MHLGFGRALRGPRAHAQAGLEEAELRPAAEGREDHVRLHLRAAREAHLQPLRRSRFRRRLLQDPLQGCQFQLQGPFPIIASAITPSNPNLQMVKSFLALVAIYRLQHVPT